MRIPWNLPPKQVAIPSNKWLDIPHTNVHQRFRDPKKVPPSNEESARPLWFYPQARTGKLCSVLAASFGSFRLQFVWAPKRIGRTHFQLGLGFSGAKIWQNLSASMDLMGCSATFVFFQAEWCATRGHCFAP